MRIFQGAQKAQRWKKIILQRLFYKHVADSNTLSMTLVLVLVSAGEVVLDDGWDNPVQPRLAVISHPSSNIFLKCG